MACPCVVHRSFLGVPGSKCSPHDVHVHAPYVCIQSPCWGGRGTPESARPGAREAVSTQVVIQGVCRLSRLICSSGFVCVMLPVLLASLLRQSLLSCVQYPGPWRLCHRRLGTTGVGRALRLSEGILRALEWRGSCVARPVGWRAVLTVEHSTSASKGVHLSSCTNLAPPGRLPAPRTFV